MPHKNARRAYLCFQPGLARSLSRGLAYFPVPRFSSSFRGDCKELNRSCVIETDCGFLARASPICASVLFLSSSLSLALSFSLPLMLSLASEILKALGGIKEISLPERVGPSEDLRLLSFLRYEASAQYAAHRKLSRISSTYSRISGSSRLLR